MKILFKNDNLKNIRNLLITIKYKVFSIDFKKLYYLDNRLLIIQTLFTKKLYHNISNLERIKSVICTMYLRFLRSRITLEPTKYGQNKNTLG